MQTKTLFASVIAALAIVPAFAADPTPGDKTVTSVGYVTRTRQPIIEAKQGDYVVMYPNDDNGDADGEVQERGIITNVYNYDEGNELVTVGGVNTALAEKQDAIPAGTSGNLVTYNGQSGSVGSAAVYNATGTYNSQTGSLVQAQHVNTAAQNAFNAHVTCSNPPDCTLWTINELSGTYVPHN